MHVKKGDKVKILAGRDKNLGPATVLKVDPVANRVVVEGVNQVKRHLKATQAGPGGILEVEAPLSASNVMPVDPETGKPTRIKFQTKDGKKERIAKSGAALPTPQE